MAGEENQNEQVETTEHQESKHSWFVLTPTTPNNKPNYYFLLACMAGLAVSVVSTLAYMAYATHTTLLATATIGASAAALGPIGAMLLMGAGLCLLPLLVAGCFDARVHVHTSSNRMFHHHDYNLGQTNSHSHVIISDGGSTCNRETVHTHHHSH